MKKTIVTLFMAVMAMGTTPLMANGSNHLVGTSNHNISRIELSSFCKAVIEGDLTTVKSLLKLGEDVNQKSLGMTPAMFAARYNRSEVLSLLIEHGANLTMKSDQGFSVKKYAELSNAGEALAIIEAALGS
ncbi:ankyrin repeat domain-containing protein [Maribacter sp. X9]|uniref:ankyrin repeat domain-containing protein n=1 Tax=Maribacter sp. X9 TaxID=3402159 RepID=UPI003AF3F13B